MGVDEQRIREDERARLQEAERARERELEQERTRSDHAMVRLDEKEIKSRMGDAFDRFIRSGFEVHLIGVEERGSFVYKLLLTEDGGDAIPMAKVQAVADELRLDIFIEKGVGLVMYARL